MSKRIKADGKTYVVPDDATDEEINQIVGPAPQTNGKLQPQGERNFVDHINNTLNNTQGNSMPMRVGKSLGRTVMGIPNMTSALAPPQTPEESAVEASPVGQGALALKRLIYDPAVDQLHKSADAFHEGHYSEGLGHGAAGLLPVIGPWAASEGERIGSGDIAGGLTDIGTAVALPKAIGAVGRKFGPPIRSASYEGMNSFIRSHKGDFDYGKNPGRGIVEEGIVAGSRPSLLNKIEDSIGDRTAERDATLRPITAKSDFGAPIRSAVSDAVKDNMGTAGPAKLTAIRMRGRELLEKPRFSADGQVSLSGRPRNMEMTPLEASQFKSQLGRNTAWSGEPFAADTKLLNRKIYGRINDKIGQMAPESAPMTRHIGDLVTGRDALGDTLARRQGQDFMPLGEIAGSGVGALMGGAHPIAGALTGGAFKGITKFTPIRTMLSQGENMLGRTLESPAPFRMTRAASLSSNLPRGVRVPNRDEDEEEK